ncbi:MAG: nucleotidyltransferase domain-containing protein [Candidatus Omnitrophota bacterium]|nr:nucleotidyltransferase domain-containing protein [Candidatus Omnitrophota bacterium]
MGILELKHKWKLNKELKRSIKVLSSQYKPRKIILFGSLANGKIRENSDIDLLVIKDTSKRYWERVDEVIHLIHPQEAMDIFVLTEKEIEDSLNKDNQYLRDILEHGKVIYEETN